MKENENVTPDDGSEDEVNNLKELIDDKAD